MTQWSSNDSCFLPTPSTPNLLCYTEKAKNEQEYSVGIIVYLAHQEFFDQWCSTLYLTDDFLDVGIISKFSRKTLVDKSSSVSLVKYNEEERKMIVNHDATDMLRRICKPVAVLGICGPYRSGKSYFGSKFMRADDFKVSRGHDPCTKGIRMSTSVLESEEFAIVFLDTEGIGAAQASEASSNEEVMKYLIITALLCSYLIYNTKGMITQDHLNQLRYVCTIWQCQHIYK